MINKSKTNPWRPDFRLLFLFLAPVLLLAALIPAQVSADGLGFTGNFYRQDFVLSKGKTSAGTDAYVIIINTDTTTAEVKVSTQAPAGVTITLPETDFTLEPGAQQRLDVVVNVDSTAALGQYNLSISAESSRPGTGIEVTGGGSQQAKLDIVNPSLNLLPTIGGGVGGLALIAVLLLLIIMQRRKNASRWMI